MSQHPKDCFCQACLESQEWSRQYTLNRLRDREGRRLMLGRNALCPCRSGKKVKRCCGTDFLDRLTMLLADTEGMSQEEIDAELRNAGFDPDRLGAEMEAFAMAAVEKAEAEEGK